MPNLSLSQPVRNGPRNPPRLPRELITAMPAAALAPERYELGMAHSGALAALTPMLMTVSAKMKATADCATPAHTKPRLAATQGKITCHLRSTVRSEWRAQATMAAMATKDGAELSRPMVSGDNRKVSRIRGDQRP